MLTSYKTIWMQNTWKCPHKYFTMAIKNCCGFHQIFEVRFMKMSSKRSICLCFCTRFGDLGVFCFISKSHCIPLCFPYIVEIRLLRYCRTFIYLLVLTKAHVIVFTTSSISSENTSSSDFDQEFVILVRISSPSTLIKVL